MKNKTEAARILNEHAEAILSIRNNQASSWRSRSIELLRIFLGPDSPFTNQLEGDELFFGMRDFSTSIKPEAYQVMKTAATHVLQFGVYKEKSNFIYRMSEGWAIAFVTIIGALIFSGAYQLGMNEQRKDNEFKNYLLTKKIDSLIISSRFRVPPSEAKTNEKANDLAKEKN